MPAPRVAARVRRALLASAGGAALALGACASGPRIEADTDPTADFGAYRTFAFHAPFGLDRDGYGTPLGEVVQQSVRDQLARRGLEYREQDPDLLVNAGGAITQRHRVDTVPAGGGYYGYRHGRYAPWYGYDQVVVTNYEEGSLTIDCIDPDRGAMVWTCTAVDRVTASARARRDEVVPAVVAEMFERFPVPLPVGAAEGRQR